MATKKIYEPFHMKNIGMKNRLVWSATWEGITAQDGSVSVMEWLFQQSK